MIFDFITLKKSHRKGTNTQTDRQTPFSTTRPNRPSEPIWWGKKNFFLKKSENLRIFYCLPNQIEKKGERKGGGNFKKNIYG